MVTIRSYANPTDAAMAKSLLDSHNIFCRLADEDVNCYGGAPLAMPIRLLAAEDQAEEAHRILEAKDLALPEDFDVGVCPKQPKKPVDANGQILSEIRRLQRTNRWFLLVSLAVLMLAMYLVYKRPRDMDPWSPVHEAMRHYNYEQALDLAKTMVREPPGDYYGHQYLGYIYAQMHKWDHADAEYSRAYELMAQAETRETARSTRASGA